MEGEQPRNYDETLLDEDDDASQGHNQGEDMDLNPG